MKLGTRDRGSKGFASAATSSALIAASIANGLLAYGLAVAASRWLDDSGFASFGVAWSLWALSVAVLIFPLQHWIAWRVASDGGAAGIRSARWRIFGLTVALIAVMASLGAIDDLFASPGPWSLVLAAVGLASAILGIGRGWLIAQGRLGAVAAVIGFENVARLAALVVVLSLGGDAPLAAVSIAAGVLALAPLLRAGPTLPDGAAGDVRVLRELGALAGAAAIAQVLVQFAPAAAELTDASAAEVSGIFSTFALTRAPVLIVLALSTQVTTPVTRALEEGRLALRQTAAYVLIVASVLAPLSFAAGWWVIPPLVEWFFGEGRALDSAGSALITAGMALATIGIGTILVLLAARQTATAALIWGLALVVAIATITVGASIPLAFLTAELVGLLGSAVAIGRAGRSRVAGQLPGE